VRYSWNQVVSDLGSLLYSFIYTNFSHKTEYYLSKWTCHNPVHSHPFTDRADLRFWSKKKTVKRENATLLSFVTRSKHFRYQHEIFSKSGKQTAEFCIYEVKPLCAACSSSSSSQNIMQTFPWSSNEAS